MKLSSIVKILIVTALGGCGWLLWQDYTTNGSSFAPSTTYKLATAIAMLESADNESQLNGGFDLLQQVKLDLSKRAIIQQTHRQTHRQIDALLAAKPALINYRQFQNAMAPAYDDVVSQLKLLQVKTWSRDNSTVSEIDLLQKIHHLLNVNQSQIDHLKHWVKSSNQPQLKANFTANLLQLNSFLDASQTGIKRLRSADERLDMAAIQLALLPINSRLELIIADFSNLYRGLYAIKWLGTNSYQLSNYQLNTYSSWGKTLQGQLLLAIAGLMITLAIIYYFEQLNALRKLKREKRYNQRAFGRLLTEVADLASGDLTVKATVGEDFTGLLATALNSAIEKLQLLAISVDDTAENVISVAHESTANSQQLHERVEQQYHQMQQYHQDLETIGKGLTQIMALVDEATQIAHSSTDLVVQSVNTLEQGQDIVKDAELQIDQARNCVTRMVDYCDQIQLVLSQFQENTEKMRLTALNTSLQAAQFSNDRSLLLMIDEIMTLNERIGTGSQQVKSLFAALNTEAKGSIGSLDLLLESLNRQNATKDDMVSKARKMVDATEYSTNLMNDLSEKTHHHHTAAQQLAAGIQQMEQSSFNSLHQIAATSSVVQELTTHALTLKKSIADYKLKPMVADVANTDNNDHAGREQYPEIELDSSASSVATNFFEDETLENETTGAKTKQESSSNAFTNN